MADPILRLAVDNNVETLPVGNLMDLGGMARDLGRRLDDGEYGNVTSIVTLVASDAGLAIHCWGENPSGYELMGIFEAAKLQAFAAADADNDDG
jgi:hypothetical protein